MTEKKSDVENETKKTSGRPSGVIFEKQYRIRMKPDTYKDLEHIAEVTGNTVARLIRFAIADFVEKNKIGDRYE